MHCFLNTLSAITLSFIFLGNPANADQKRWVLIWATHVKSSQINMMNIHQHGDSYGSLNACHDALRKNAFYQKEHNDNEFFENIKVWFITPERLIASVEDKNGPFDNFHQLSCIEIKMD